MQKSSLDYAGDSFPASEPAHVENNSQPQHDWNPVEQYNLFYGNGQLHISEAHDHDELASHAQVPADHAGPMAVGHVHVDMGKATFEIESNIHAQGLARILKDYCKQAGWRWGGLTDLQGEPVGTGSEFAPVKSYYFSADCRANVVANNVTFAKNSRNLHGQLHGVVHIDGKLADVRPFQPEWWPAMKEWADDSGFLLCSGNDNVMKKIEDLEQSNLYTPEWNADDDHFMFRDPKDERKPGGVYKCPECAQIFPNWGIYIQHRRSEEPNGDVEEHGGFPELDSDATFPAHYHEAPSFTEARVAAPSPKDMIAAPIPFVYDIDEDSVTVGQPGQKTSDIPGKFTPGGIVEGTYEPGGKVMLHTVTNMPYTVRHMLELWYYNYPHMEVKSVNLMTDDGGTKKLAADREFANQLQHEDVEDWERTDDGQAWADATMDGAQTTRRSASGEDVGGYLMGIMASDPAAWKAERALRAAGGQVFIVGGAVRDAIMGKPPKDIDLMVTGLPPDAVDKTLRDLQGRVDLTGKDFGVFRYKDGHGEVEVALPRRERSTGVGHQDFHVQADHTMTPEEDLYRRDFTANAIAVNTATGQLIDPYNGVKDIQSGKLRTLNTKSLADDPLRTVRALVASSKHGLDPDENTMSQMEENAAGIKNLPRERIQAELDKLFAGKDPAKAIELARDSGVLPHLFPHVDKAMGYSQNNPHHELMLGDHLVSVLRNVAKKSDDPDLRLAGLLHDIGKPDSHWSECKDCGHEAHGHFKPCPQCDSPNTAGHFYEKKPGIGGNHETVGADLAQDWMRNMKYPNDRIQRVTGLVQNHMYPAFQSPKGARKFLNRVGDQADDLLKLRWADQGGKGVDPNDPSHTKSDVDAQQKLIDEARQSNAPTAMAQLAINGRDLIAMGIKPGPALGAILQHCLQSVVDNPQLNTKDALLGIAHTWTPAQ